MNIIPYMIAAPFVAAVLIYLIRVRVIRNIITSLFVPAIMGMTGYLCYCFFTGNQATKTLYLETETIDHIMIGGEVVLALLVCVLCIIHKKYWVILLSVIPTALCIYTELSGLIKTEADHIHVDRLSVLMCMIIAIVGGLIVIYALGYMKGYHNHHTDVKDRSYMFIALLFVFLGAMYGLVLSANLIWIFFFWEVTSITSFLLIGYTRSPEAVTNSFRALWMNLLGGFGFAIAIFYMAYEYGSVELADVISHKAMIAVILLAFAALTKSAQFPFSGWLLGAMVAPTPSSALLHSATMVKAGCYLLLRLSPVLGGSTAGMFVCIIGAFTFLMSSFLAITVSDGKKVLAYSTISNLGLIVTCAGVGTPGAVWAGVFLLIFHAVTKSMLFQCVGAIENSTHNRDVEGMAGLLVTHKKLAYIMILGILGMYVAPFGMLIFKWAALKSFIDAGITHVFLVIVIAFGSSTTLFYWTKWLCRIISSNKSHEKGKDVTTFGQYLSMFVHSIMVIGLCASFALISKYYVAPFIEGMYGESASFLSKGNLSMMVILVVLIFLVPIYVKYVENHYEIDELKTYVAGASREDGTAFKDSYDETTKLQISNWYLEDWFGEKVLFKPSVWISSVLVLASIVTVVVMTLV